MSTVIRPITADELLKLPRGKFRHELIKGELLTMSPAGGEHGAVIGTLSILPGNFVRQNGLGVVFGAETGFLIERAPDTVRAPDIAFVSRQRIPPDGIPTSYVPGAPNLAVEVVSPGDTIREVDDKVADWLTAGCEAVWVINPRSKTVTAYLAGGEITILTADQTLDAGIILPGFHCTVAEIFAFDPR